MYLGESYFNWLYSRVRTTRNMSSYDSYGLVCDRMHQIIFDCSVPNDDNRAGDGKELRRAFFYQEGYPLPSDQEALMRDEATVFEVLVALCMRAEDMSNLDADQWFDQMLKNLDLEKFSDAACHGADNFEIIRKIRKMNERRYRYSGRGGLFPLGNYSTDQRKVELWYQLSAYIHENRMC